MSNGVARFVPCATSLLDELGALAAPLPQGAPQEWKRQLHSPATAHKRAPLLHISLGEWLVSAGREPLQAAWHFEQARRLAGPSTDANGLAAYDHAIAMAFAGKYDRGLTEFARLIDRRTRLRGYDRRTAALWYRHVRACAGFHAGNRDRGIPEPAQLDPECGAAALAAWLRANQMPYDRHTVLQRCRVTGRGSSMADVAEAANLLGADAVAVQADETGLQRLPKPLMAHVEGDHFIAITRADSRGVSYLCSDCGPWPGGPVSLTWQQFRRLEPGAYLVFRRHNPQAAVGTREPAALRLAAVSRAVRHGRAVCAAGARDPSRLIWVAGLLSTHVGLYIGQQGAYCGFSPYSIHDTPASNCPTDSSGSGNCGGSSQGDPVSLVTGEEQYAPEPDLIVPNPLGPAVRWSRLYGSLRGPGEVAYDLDDFGDGWSTAYNIHAVVNGNDDLRITLPNGASYRFSAPGKPTATNPRQIATPYVPGVPMELLWDYTDGTGYNITVLHTDRSRWLFKNLPSAKSKGGTVRYSLCEIWDRNGNKLQLAYDGFGQKLPGIDTQFPLLKSISDSNGAALLTMERTTGPDHSIKSVTDRYGRTVYYGCSTYPIVNAVPGYVQAQRELETVSQIVPTGAAHPPARFRYSYTYYPNGNGIELVPMLTGITVPSPTGAGNSTTTITYGGDNLYVRSVTDGSGNQHVYEDTGTYHTLVTVLHPGSPVVASYKVAFDDRMREVELDSGINSNLKAVRITSYTDNQGFPPTSVQLGGASSANVTKYTWDQFGHPQEVDGPRGDKVVYTWVYPDSGHPDIYPLGELQQVQQFGTDGTPRTPTTFVYNEPSGNIKQMTVPAPGSAAGTVTYNFTYDNDNGPGLGNLLTATGPGNNATDAITTTYGYTNDGSYSQLAALGKPITVTDNAGHVTHLRYDGRYNLASVVNGIAGEADLATEIDMAYNLADQLHTRAAPVGGDLSAYVTVTPTSPQASSGNITVTNASGATLAGPFRLTVTNLTPGVIVSNSTGTYLGSPYFVSSQSSLAANASLSVPVSFSNPSQLPVFYNVQVYSLAGGRAQVIFGHVYTGGPLNRIDVLDEAGNLFRTVNYSLGQEAERLAVTGVAQPVAYKYDAAYRVVGLTDGNGHTTRFTYSVEGYLKQVTYPNGDTVRYPKYDALANPLRRIDGRGIQTDYVYSALDERLTDVKYHKNAGFPGIEKLSVHLDYGDPFIRLHEVVDGSGVTTWAYDERDDPLTVTTAYRSGPKGQIGYDYYPDGSRSLMITPAGRFGYQYDAVGRMVALSDPFSHSAYGWSYLENGLPLSRTLPNGVASRYAFDGKGLRIDVTHYASNGAFLADYGRLTYDPTGNRLTKLATVPGLPALSGPTVYQYDSTDQLRRETLQATAGFADGFSPDHAGNLTGFGAASFVFNADNELTGSSFNYDKSGNPILYKSAGCAFDPENRLTAYGAAMTAGYRADGLRAWKASSAGTTYFLYDGIQPVCELDAAGNVTAVNVFGADGLLARRSAAGNTYYTFDPQGSVSMRLDANGTPQTSCSYRAFGTPDAPSPDPFGYGGQWGYYTDGETGLQLLGLRYYDPAVGRFVTRDPIGYAGGSNIYEAFLDTPTSLVDPAGLCAAKPHGGLGAALGRLFTATWHGAYSGAVTGGIAVGAAGLAAGGVGAIPGVISGIVGGAALGALSGAASVVISSGLEDLGVPKADAEVATDVITLASAGVQGVRGGLQKAAFNKQWGILTGRYSQATRAMYAREATDEVMGELTTELGKDIAGKGIDKGWPEGTDDGCCRGN